MNQPASPDISQIRQRALLLKELRSFFDSHSFLEVQPPCLSQDCVVDAYIDPIELSSDQFGIGIDLPDRYFLQTSPEAAMKRLLAAGAPSIYSIGPVFRAGERGLNHNIEFTMLEWYEVGADLLQGIETLSNLANVILGRGQAKVLTYRQLFRDVLGFDPINASLNVLHQHTEKVDAELLRVICDDRDQMLDVLLSHLIQPQLGKDQPVIIRNYPISQAALSQAASDDDQCAARFELFVDGIELANGYDELRDPDVLLARAAQANAKRVAAGRSELKIESKLVAAMREGLPDCAGVALGVDRLLMVRTDLASIEKSIPFPIEIA